MKAVWPLNTQFNPVNKKFYPRRRKASPIMNADEWHKGTVKGQPRGSQPKPFTNCPCGCLNGKKWDRKKNLWRDCVGCLKTPGRQPIDKGFVYDEE